MQTKIKLIKDAVRRAGKHCGVVTTGGDDLKQRREQDFSLLALGLDGGLLLRAMATLLAAATGKQRTISSALTPSAIAPQGENE